MRHACYNFLVFKNFTYSTHIAFVTCNLRNLHMWTQKNLHVRKQLSLFLLILRFFVQLNSNTTKKSPRFLNPALATIPLL